jgi:ComF family protein
MRVLQNLVEEAVVGFRQMLFPGVCLSCGMPDVDGMDLLCPFCREDRFDPANPFRTDTCPGVILPVTVRYQYAMWRYDKGGVLQRLLHNIKYNGLGRLAFELGSVVGIGMRACPALDGSINAGDSLCLLPVPLHPRRKRLRGFNQAEVIALGISQVTGIPVVDDDVVVRTRYTSTQTGFSLLARSRNLSGAFSLNIPEEIYGKSVIIVDDVFTTGATAFALAEVIKQGSPAEVGVVTIAHA